MGWLKKCLHNDVELLHNRFKKPIMLFKPFPSCFTASFCKVKICKFSFEVGAGFCFNLFQQT